MAKATLPITDFSKEELDGLKRELEKAGIGFKETNYMEMDASGGMWPALLIYIVTPATITGLSHVLASYFKHRQRKVTFNYMTGADSFEGYSADDIKKILEARQHGRIEIGDRKPNDGGTTRSRGTGVGVGQCSACADLNFTFGRVGKVPSVPS